jgi:hypothetical protein
MPPPAAEHHFVSASLDGVSGRLLGDLLVHRWSAEDRRAGTEPLRFDVEHYRHLDGVNHFDLLSHPAVAELLTGWVGRAPRGAPGRSG